MHDFVYKKLHLVLLVTSVTFLAVVIFQNNNIFLKKFDGNDAEKAYYKSQWALKDSKNPISDTQLYSYAGHKYVQGTSPILVNPEHPPIGKYLIGLSTVIFQNEKVISLLAAILSLILIYLITYDATKSKLASSLSIFLVSTHDLFLNQIIESPQLDILQLLFFLLFVFLILMFFKKERLIFLVPAGLAFGALLGIKTFPIYVFIFNLWLGLLFVIKFRRKLFLALKTLIGINLIALAAYCISYLTYFTQGSSLKDFLGVQKWIVSFYQSSTIDNSKLFGDYLGLLFANKWQFWTEGYPIIHYAGWSITWPILTLIGIYSIYRVYSHVKSKNNALSDAFWLFLTFFIVYNLFLFITPVFPRYFLLLFIPLIMITSMNFSFYFRKLNFK